MFIYDKYHQNIYLIYILRFCNLFGMLLLYVQEEYYRNIDHYNDIRKRCALKIHIRWAFLFGGTFSFFIVKKSLS